MERPHGQRPQQVWSIAKQNNVFLGDIRHVRTWTPPPRHRYFLAHECPSYTCLLVIRRLDGLSHCFVVFPQRYPEEKYVIPPLLLPYPYHLTVRFFVGHFFFLFFIKIKKKKKFPFFSPGVHLVLGHLCVLSSTSRACGHMDGPRPRKLMLTGLYETNFCMCLFGKNMSVVCPNYWLEIKKIMNL